MTGNVNTITGNISNRPSRVFAMTVCLLDALNRRRCKVNVNALSGRPLQYI